jgi:hypothetical protein
MPPLDFEEIPDAGDQQVTTPAADLFSSSFGGEEQQSWNNTQSMEPTFGGGESQSWSDTSFGGEVPAEQEQQSSWMPEPEQDDALT